MAKIALVTPELLFGSKIEGTLRAAGHEVELAPSISQADLGRAELLVADLDVESAAALVGAGMPVLGYYAHTNVETRRAAEAAGVGIVVPRSRMAREMVELVERALAS